MAAESLADADLSLELVTEALRLPHFDAQAARAPMLPATRPLQPRVRQDAVEAAVLLLLWPQGGSLHFVLTRRARDLRGHGGQISLPGGRCDPDDSDHRATALRETEEELGIAASDAQVLGPLDRIYIPPSNYMVYPLVAALPAPPCFRPRDSEVAEVLQIPLAFLLDPQRKRESLQHRNGRSLRIPWYALGGQMVWGATAMLLSEFEGRLRAASKRQSCQ
ncbi:MAG: CoA pyrophosphatase [Anaerolineaceae bacterium]|nr:CoA pyrophosphatase [Anaerolineaceae bacterium]